MQALLWIALAVSQPVTTSTAGTDEDCESLFGDANDHDLNEAWRLRQLVLVEAGPEYVDVVQTGTWDVPLEVDFDGLSLVDSTLDEDGEPVAVFRVEPDLGVCAAGEYEVGVDASLGTEGRLLAIAEDWVLIEHRDRLAFIRSENASGPPPVFKVSWQSSFSMMVSQPTRTGRAKARARARARARRRR